MVTIKDSTAEVVEVAKVLFEEFLKEDEVSSKGNKSAARRARNISLDLREYLKQYKSLSMKEQKGE